VWVARALSLGGSVCSLCGLKVKGIYVWSFGRVMDLVNLGLEEWLGIGSICVIGVLSFSNYIMGE